MDTMTPSEANAMVCAMENYLRLIKADIARDDKEYFRMILAQAESAYAKMLVSAPLVEYNRQVNQFLFGTDEMPPRVTPGSYLV